LDTKQKQDQSSTSIDNKNDGAEDMPLDEFYSDEEPENFESQKEDMKMYLNKLNKRIDTLVDALKEADTKMASMKDQKAIMDQINNKKKNAGSDKKKDSIAELFKNKISHKS
jgi:hypothetical protein